MKNFIKLFCMSVLIILSNRITVANWIKSENDMQLTSHDRNASQSQNTPHSNSDSLPAGVTRGWLNSLTDERGQKIVHPEEEGDAMQERYFTGFAANDQFGFSLSSAGDVNGDGYSDLIIGAPLNDAAGASAGRAYIYYGGTIINSIVDVVLTGLVTNDQFGISVSKAGDVNGDGYSDVIVGANLNDGGGSNAGRAYIFFGGSSMNNVADIILTGAAANDQFGVSVSTAGDVNGDGYSDVIVGASSNDAGGSNAGRAYVYFGGSTMNNTADVLLTGEAASDGLGISVVNAEDVNGDGYGDVISGASGNDAGGTSAGRAYIYFGGSSMNSIADVIMTGAAANDLFGGYLSTAGDVNGDGFSDVIVGANLNDAGGADAGRAYLYLGGSSPDNIADVILTGAVAGDRLGNSVSTAGDLNGDGYSDVIAGAPLNDAGGTNTGRAYVYFGGNVMDSTADVLLTGAASNDQYGWSVSTAGDMNGDGYSDMLSGSIFNDAGGSNAGRVYIYLNSMTGADIADENFTGVTANDRFGTSVSSAGDFNGDGFGDIIIGAYLNDAGGADAGRVYVYYGGSIQDNIADVILTGEAAGDQFGISVSAAGDVNNDGYSDLIVGANGSDSGGSNSGRAYIYLGGSVPDNTADVKLTGDTAGDNFGYSVSSAGDINGDGYSDVITGALSSDILFIDGGAAYIYFGGFTMNNVADATFPGLGNDDALGYSVSGAGDINGDGFSDVVVGAYLDNNTYVNSGSAFVYFGGTVPDTVADLKLQGSASNDQFGVSVSSAGDVNNDGYSDLIIGANGNDSGGVNSGSVYLYFGGFNPDITPDLILTGSSAGDEFGLFVSTVLDINSDGYDDFAICAPFNDAVGISAGRTFVYFGGKSPDNKADIIMSGESANDFFGSDVASVGDINNDGYNDILVGALLNDAAGIDAGRAYLYLSSAPSVKPILNELKDVPNDQGGQVYLKWTRSGYDVPGIDKIVSYSVLRSFPPVNGNFSWQTVSEINAEQLPFYSYIDHTPLDSTSNNSGMFFYKIKAKTVNISEYWYSAILTGRSIDNIAPLMVSPFTAAPVVNNVLLNWNRNSSPDLLNYVLYRSTSPVIDPDTEPVFATTTDSTYLDTAPLSGVYYYFIVAQDIHNNKSPVAVAQSPNITLNMTMFIEGFYNSSTDLQVSDTIKVYLRNTVTPFAKVDSAKTVVSANGSAALLFGNAPTGQYYIVTTHRNSLETWSKSGGESLVRESSMSYNFSNASSQAYGNNMKPIDASPVRFADFSGDVNQDGFINLTDVVGIYNDAGNFVTGYKVTDVSGDSITDLSDVIIANNNSVGFVNVVKP